ncbi:hypothetical protein CLMAG_29580 [Clostridium magnum DSM 2767]|uniref:Uncharacterized protein n=1 Tax=Clostridium magnum DSM 2767 TaxID=1121326 RepID=A0A162SG04_9CLOT|nr:hypothetical protein CLMAG_29580 [Clostridium magnum DSM 2767]
MKLKLESDGFRLRPEALAVEARLRQVSQVK